MGARGPTARIWPLARVLGLALTCAAKLPPAGPVIPWDPVTLNASWWLPNPDVWSQTPRRKNAQFGYHEWRTCDKLKDGVGVATIRNDAVAGDFAAANASPLRDSLVAGAGKLGAALLVVKNALEVMVTSYPSRRLVLSTTEWSGTALIVDAFNLVNATRNWSCVVATTRKVRLPSTAPVDRRAVVAALAPAQRPLLGPTVDVLSPMRLLRLRHMVPVALGAWSPARLFFENVLAQLLTRPAARLRAYVEAFEARHGLRELVVYGALHVETLDGDCFRRAPEALAALLSPLAVKHAYLPPPKYSEPAATAATVCRLSDAYLASWLDALALPADAPLVVFTQGDAAAARIAALRLAPPRRLIVVNDEPSLGRAVRLRSGAYAQPELIGALLVMRAPVYIGDPLSLLSHCIAAARYALLRDPRINLRRNAVGIYPLPGEPPGGQPLGKLPPRDKAARRSAVGMAGGLAGMMQRVRRNASGSPG
jgi:hypothetical protein